MRQPTTGITPNWGNCNRKKDRTAVRFGLVLWMFRSIGLNLRTLIFLHENKTKSHDFNTFKKLRERATTAISWKKSPNKSGPCPKREIDPERLMKNDPGQGMKNVEGEE
jgi:hypothetical protein